MATIYERMFGLKPCIMAGGSPYASKQGGAKLHPDIVEAMREAAAYNIDMIELHERAGAKICKMVGAEAAFITSGACAGLTLSAAAAMTGMNVKLMEQLPNTEHPVKMKNELIMQLGHVTHYLGCLQASGAKIIEVGGGYLPRGEIAGTTLNEYNSVLRTADEEGWQYYPIVYDQIKKKFIRVFKVLPGHIENAINERTAGLVYVRSHMCVRGEYEVHLDELVKIARKHNIPVIVDFASELQKKSNLKWVLERGVDLVVFSGGKDIMGPNDTGLILGRKELIEAIKLNSSPHYRTILGRGFKVSKEQIVGFVVALERFLKIDEQARLKRDADICQYIADRFKGFPHVEATVHVPDLNVPDEEVEGIYRFPVVHLKIDEKALGVKASEVGPQLWKGNPQIYLPSDLTKWGIIDIITRNMLDEEKDIVVDGIKRVLSKNLK